MNNFGVEMENNQTPLLRHVIYAAIGATSLDAAQQVNSAVFQGVSFALPAKRRRVEFSPRGGYWVVLHPKSGLGERLTLPPKAGWFSVEYLGFFCSVCVWL